MRPAAIASLLLMPSLPSTETRQAARETWYHQPVLWLGLVILLATVAGCIAMMVLGARYDSKSEIVSAQSQGQAHGQAQKGATAVGFVFGVPLRTNAHGAAQPPAQPAAGAIQSTNE